MNTAPLHLTVPGQPVAKARARVCFNRGKVRSFTPDKTARYENLVRDIFREQFPNHVPFAGAIELSIVAFFQAPKAMIKKYPHFCGAFKHTKRPDLSNIFKLAEDALEGVAFINDSRISDYGPSKKRYSPRPRLEITIVQLQPETPADK